MAKSPTPHGVYLQKLANVAQRGLKRRSYFTLFWTLLCTFCALSLLCAERGLNALLITSFSLRRTKVRKRDEEYATFTLIYVFYATLRTFDKTGSPGSNSGKGWTKGDKRRLEAPLRKPRGPWAPRDQTGRIAEKGEKRA